MGCKKSSWFTLQTIIGMAVCSEFSFGNVARVINPITCEPLWGAFSGAGIDNAQCLNRQKKIRTSDSIGKIERVCKIPVSYDVVKSAVSS
jgi:hypothetical protein